MTSQLVVVDLTKSGRQVNFSELTREPSDCMLFYTSHEDDHFNLHQFVYNPEFSNWQKLEFCIFWGFNHRPLPEKERVESDLEKRIRKLC